MPCRRREKRGACESIRYRHMKRRCSFSVAELTGWPGILRHYCPFSQPGHIPIAIDQHAWSWYIRRMSSSSVPCWRNLPDRASGILKCGGAAVSSTAWRCLFHHLDAMGSGTCFHLAPERIRSFFHGKKRKETENGCNEVHWTGSSVRIRGALTFSRYRHPALAISSLPPPKCTMPVHCRVSARRFIAPCALRNATIS